jgi:hypothetical protein
MESAYCTGNTALAQQHAQNMFNEIYGATGTFTVWVSTSGEAKYQTSGKMATIATAAMSSAARRGGWLNVRAVNMAGLHGEACRRVVSAAAAYVTRRPAPPVPRSGR